MEKIHIIIVLLLFFNKQIDASDKLQDHWYNHVYLYGYGCMSTNFVKAWEYPVGTQYEYIYGGMLLLKFDHFSPFLQMAYHDAFISVPNGYVVYRKFSGFDASIGSRIPFHSTKGVSAEYEYGTGLLISGSFDKYDGLGQYMVYPKGTVEFYIHWESIQRLRCANIGLLIPIKFAFRPSGNYLGIGFATEIGLRKPSKHE